MTIPNKEVKASRVPCYYCRYLQYDNLIVSAPNLRINRLLARFRELWERRICEALRIEVTHPCSEEHRDAIKLLRSKARVPLTTERRSKNRALKEARKRYDKVVKLIGELKFTSRHETPNVDVNLVLQRLEIEKSHLERVISQRQRRLNELYINVM